ncbi:unnamed protein product [Heligmosomoides polygyrus]|uniref:Reverse transcriptase domain-containing protein n=1 Tax=Heligmosomoides polygyrus TaxID=6339 RepID=A0A183GFY7_HELPZ|nr:unnamed protein product [Heligmosomoides polygyrus]
MAAITRHLRKPVPWTLLYADDVMLACEDKGELEQEVQALCDLLGRFRVKLNVKKCEYLTSDVAILARERSLAQVALLTGVLCDKKIPERFKSKIYIPPSGR